MAVKVMYRRRRMVMGVGGARGRRQLEPSYPVQTAGRKKLQAAHSRGYNARLPYLRAYPFSPGSRPSIRKTLSPWGTLAASTKATAPGIAATSSVAISFEKTTLGPLVASARNTLEIQNWRNCASLIW